MSRQGLGKEESIYRHKEFSRHASRKEHSKPSNTGEIEHVKQVDGEANCLKQTAMASRLLLVSFPTETTETATLLIDRMVLGILTFMARSVL